MPRHRIHVPELEEREQGAPELGVDAFADIHWQQQNRESIADARAQPPEDQRADAGLHEARHERPKHGAGASGHCDRLATIPVG